MLRVTGNFLQPCQELLRYGSGLLYRLDSSICRIHCISAIAQDDGVLLSALKYHDSGAVLLAHVHLAGLVFYAGNKGLVPQSTNKCYVLLTLQGHFTPTPSSFFLMLHRLNAFLLTRNGRCTSHMTFQPSRAGSPSTFSFLDNDAGKSNYLGDWNIAYHGLFSYMACIYWVGIRAALLSSQNKSERLPNNGCDAVRTTTRQSVNKTHTALYNEVVFPLNMFVLWLKYEWRL